MTSNWWKVISRKTKPKSLKESNSNFKHEKLSEEIPSDGSTFQCQYLGCIPVENPSGVAINHAAIKKIMSLSRVQGIKNCRKIVLSILPNKIIMKPIANNSPVITNAKKKKKLNIFSESNRKKTVQFPLDDDFITIEIPLNRVSYCFVDSSYNRVIAFVATNDHGCHECHAFLVQKTKIAKSIALTISKAFINAYEKWIQQKVQAASAKSKEDQQKEGGSDGKNGKEPSSSSSSPSLASQQMFNNNNNDNFDNGFNKKTPPSSAVIESFEKNVKQLSLSIQQDNEDADEDGKKKKGNKEEKDFGKKKPSQRAEDKLLIDWFGPLQNDQTDETDSLI